MRVSLSRTPQARWASRTGYTRSRVTDTAILENPYRIVELDLGDGTERPVPLGMVDRGLMPDATIAAAHPVPAPSNVGSPSTGAGRALFSSLFCVTRACRATRF